MRIARVRDGRIEELWMQSNQLDVLGQLDALDSLGS